MLIYNLHHCDTDSMDYSCFTCRRSIKATKVSPKRRKKNDLTTFWKSHNWRWTFASKKHAVIIYQNYNNSCEHKMMLFSSCRNNWNRAALVLLLLHFNKQLAAIVYFNVRKTGARAYHKQLCHFCHTFNAGNFIFTAILMIDKRQRWEIIF